jgi:hypothetical protein
MGQPRSKAHAGIRGSERCTSDLNRIPHGGITELLGQHRSETWFPLGRRRFGKRYRIDNRRSCCFDLHRSASRLSKLQSRIPSTGVVEDATFMAQNNLSLLNSGSRSGGKGAHEVFGNPICREKVERDKLRIVDSNAFLLQLFQCKHHEARRIIRLEFRDHARQILYFRVSAQKHVLNSVHQTWS